MTPEQAKQKAEENKVQEVKRIANLLIELIDIILVREIYSLLEGDAQRFKMIDFSKQLTNADQNIYYRKNYRIDIDDIIVKHYNANEWKAKVEGEVERVFCDIVINTK